MTAFPIDSATISWVDGDGVHIRVYWSDGYTVKERCWDMDRWATGQFSQAGADVSATCWNDGGIHIRVYCTFEDKSVEWCLDPGGSWYRGAFTIE